MNRTRLLARILALVVVVAFLADWRLVPWFVGDPMSVGGLVFLTYLVLSVAACVGLLRRRRWGFYSFDACVLFGTILLSVPFIPIPLGFLPLGERWIGLTLLNLIVLSAGALGERWLRVDTATV